MAGSGVGASWGQIAVWEEEKVQEMGQGDAVPPWETFQAAELCPKALELIFMLFSFFFAIKQNTFF